MKNTKEQRMPFYALLLMILVFWISFGIAKMNRPSWVSYSVTEAFYVPVNLGLFLIPIMAVAILVSMIVKMVRKESVGRSFVGAILVLAIVGIHIVGVAYEFSFYTTTGYDCIVNKENEEDSYYLYIQNGQYLMKLECSEEAYEKVEINPEIAYEISFSWSTWTPNRGKLIEIDPTDKINNVKETQ